VRGVCSGDGSSCDFGYNQSQVQAAYFIDGATLSGLDDGDLVIARFNGLVVGASSAEDLVVQGADLDISIDGEVFEVCATTGTCDYPSDGDSVHLSIWDDSAQTEYTPYSVSDNGTSDVSVSAQTIVFSAMINADLISVSISEDCNGDLGGAGGQDGCGDCVQPDDIAGYLDECGECQNDGDASDDNDCSQDKNISFIPPLTLSPVTWKQSLSSDASPSF
jgi:hypothetical protein